MIIVHRRLETHKQSQQSESLANHLAKTTYSRYPQQVRPNLARKGNEKKVTHLQEASFRICQRRTKLK
jgi:hypothetical protein